MDSSYLNEILTTDKHLSNISSTITNLMRHSNILKDDVTKIIENQSIQYNAISKENNRLKSKAEDLLQEMNKVEDKIETDIKKELSICTKELEGLSYSLKEVNLFLKILKQLLEIDFIVKEAKKKIQNHEYYECAILIKNAQNSIKMNSEKLEKIEVFKILSQEVTLTYEHLMHKISEIWSNCVKISVNNDLGENMNVSKITLTVHTQKLNDIAQILKASCQLNLNINEKKFSYKLLNDMLNKIINHKTNLKLNVEEKQAVLSVEIVNTKEKPNYLEVFEKVKVAIEFLKSHLDIEIEENKKFLPLMGSFIAKDFADNLIKNVLSETIPSSSEDLDNYKNVISNAEEFEKSLQSIGFLPGNSNSLIDYARNINTLFSNKFCQSFLNKARIIMKKDLHNITMSEEVISNVNALHTSYKNVLKIKMNIEEDVFLFPKCQISKHAKEMVNLLYSIISEIQKSMELCAVRLFFTVRNIFEMYCAVVPLHHRKFLESLPQQVALLHNNCMYFAHNLIRTVTEFQDKVPHILISHFPILLEEAVTLRCLAVESLEATVTNQRAQLIYILRDSGFATLNENPKLDSNSEKSIRQCIRQLQILKAVWNEVLPLKVYNRAMGFLTDAVVEELMSLIIAVEDISSQTASDLVSSFTIIIERVPTLFLDEKEVHMHVKKWQKFREFVLILNGSLRDIDDRWADGMGPLAVEFTPEQVKHLIRALFQNSNRRAALLARIR